MEYLVVWVGFSIVAAMWADHKGRDGMGYFFLSLFLSPLVGLIAAGVAKETETKRQQRVKQSSMTRICPQCLEMVPRGAVKCRNCGASLRDYVAGPASAPPRPQTRAARPAPQEDSRWFSKGEIIAIVVIVVTGLAVLYWYFNF